jgi:hypothetical protein
MIHTDTIPVPAKGLSVRELGDAIIIINENGDEIHTLDEVGSFIWQTIDGRCSFNDILAKLCGEYEVEKPTAEEDLRKFLELLKEKKLIRI